MAYQLLIVDDEPYVANSLADVFSQIEEPEYETHAAYSAVDALEILESRKVDIVLSDVKMPEMDGLELSNHIQRRWPQVKVVFLSGYDDFHIAQSAIRHNGVDYVLKTETDEAIQDAVAKAVERLRREAVRASLIERARRHIERARPVLRREYLSNLVTGAEGHPDESRFGELGIPLDPHSDVLLMVARVDSIPPDGSLRWKARLYELEGAIAPSLWKTVHLATVHLDVRRILFLMQPRNFTVPGSKEELARVRALMWGDLEKTQQDAREVIGTPVSFVIAKEAVDWRNLPTACEELCLILKSGAGLGSSMIISADRWNDIASGSEATAVRAEVAIHIRALAAIDRFLESRNREDLSKLLRDIVAFFTGHDLVPYEVSVQAYSSLVTSFLDYIGRSGLHAAVAREIDYSRMLNINHFASWEEIGTYFLSLADVILAVQKEQRTESENRTIARVNAYIDEHLHEDVSLTRLADEVGLNPSYLSRLYTRETGRHLSDHIDSRRLNRATELLQQTNLRIAEITDRVGFNNASYFIRFFKKHTGVTPQEYREPPAGTA
jgi:two-component system response regulator YesN